MNTSPLATKHGPVNRTSPKGSKFFGTCAACGKPGLTIADVAEEECPNQRGLTEDEAILEAIDGEPRQVLGKKP
jgi:hypothetical protein